MDAADPVQIAEAHARSQEALLEIEDPVERVTELIFSQCDPSHWNDRLAL